MMDIDANGKVLRHNIFESVIRSVERMTYTDVYKILELEDAELIERYSHLAEDFRRMKELALILRSRRMARGAWISISPRRRLSDKRKARGCERYE